MSSVEEFKNIQEEFKKAISEEEKMQVEFNLLKKQGAEILKSYGYSSFNDLAKMKEKIEELEAEAQKSIKEMEEYIAYVNKKKEEKDNILLG